MSPSPSAMSKSMPILRRSRRSSSIRCGSNATSCGRSSTRSISPTSSPVSFRPAPSSRKKPPDDGFGIPDRRHCRPSFCAACALSLRRAQESVDRARAGAAVTARRAGGGYPAPDRRQARRRCDHRRTRRTVRSAARSHRWRCRADAAGSRRQEDTAAVTLAEPPLALLAELTHRCPLRCPYCSNPLELARASAELDTATWSRVFNEAAALGVLQVHFSGGEPLVRRDLIELVEDAAKAGLYVNLITSGIRLDADRLTRLVEAGLEHVQLSLQDSDPALGDRIAGLAGAQQTKHRAARLVREAGLPLTVNAVVHQQNLEHLEDIIDLAVALGADRLEVAHVQYYGWAVANRAALLPSRQQLDTATATVEAARAGLIGRLVIDYVPPDYHAHRPKACMGGWGRRFLNITPAGKVLPCHAAETRGYRRLFDTGRKNLARDRLSAGGNGIRTIGPAEKETAVERGPAADHRRLGDDLCLMTPSSFSSATAERPFTRAGPMVRIPFPPADSPQTVSSATSLVTLPPRSRSRTA